jgi:kynurenine formamidase
MKLKTFVIAFALALALFLVAQQRTAPTPRPEFRTVVDLTHTVSEKSPNWEGTAKSPYSAHDLSQIEKDGYFTRSITLPEHFSTHLDAPAHFVHGAWTVDQIPAQRLIGPLVVIDVTAKVKQNPDYRVSAEDIAMWEQSNGEISPGAIVVARTGWSERWNSMADYRHADSAGVLHFPGFSLDAARFLVESRNVVGLGIDTLSVDYGPAKDFPVHHYTAAHGVYHLENVADLGQVPASGAIALVAPAKLEGGSGAPVRILALVR